MKPQQNANLQFCDERTELLSTIQDLVEIEVDRRRMHRVVQDLKDHLQNKHSLRVFSTLYINYYVDTWR